MKINDNYDAIKSYFNSLNKEDIIYKDGETLFEACQKIVAKEFGSEKDDKEVYLENLQDFCALMYCAQPWFTPPERNDVALKIISED